MSQCLAPHERVAGCPSFTRQEEGRRDQLVITGNKWTPPEEQSEVVEQRGGTLKSPRCSGSSLCYSFWLLMKLWLCFPALPHGTGRKSFHIFLNSSIPVSFPPSLHRYFPQSSEDAPDVPEAAGKLTEEARRWKMELTQYCTHTCTRTQIVNVPF